jgi:hypothetical protein
MIFEGLYARLHVYRITHFIVFTVYRIDYVTACVRILCQVYESLSLSLGCQTFVRDRRNWLECLQ